MNAIHFLRPYGFLIIIPMVLVWYWMYHQKNHKQWKIVCDEHLLPYLIDEQSSSRLAIYRFIFFSLFLAIAISGPTWRQLQTPVFKKMDTRIIVFGLAPSLYAQDLKPSRLVRARYKLIDLLKHTQEGQTGLIVYGNEPYVVAPVTEDSNTLINLVPVLEPSILPSNAVNSTKAIVGESVMKAGISNALATTPTRSRIASGFRDDGLKSALKQAEQLMQQSNQLQGSIIVITDQDVSEDAIKLAEKLREKNMRVSVLAVGTKQGAPIPLAQGGFMKDASGKMVLAKLNTTNLNKLARSGGGKFVTMRSSNSDVDELLNQHFTGQTKKSNQEAILWKDEGAWFVLGMLPFVLMGFRRAWFGVRA